ncbi:MAG TPA: LysM peptidoglycan-binding domain-containing protein [Chlorobaculum parvum]|uniref:LysM peptidoglycan-binding domain-containing protein n=1 Tax=Chlorobaculum parvum TaxID=274539 RepID=A0A7C5DBV5_9CHLB|nr:LysM peptidoglycan-binding domain-containing protein [Chlorobaculum parvum]
MTCLCSDFIHLLNSAKLVKNFLRSGFFLFCVIMQTACFHSDAFGRQYYSVPEMRASRVNAMLDSLVRTTYVQPDHFYSERTVSGGDVFPEEFIPQFTDSVYVFRIAALARKSRFNLVYNQHVKGFIRVYAVDKRKAVSKVLGLTSLYFPLFEEKLREYNIPPEMKYLPIVESALNSTAVSRAGARGLWQFMSGTGRMYGLQTSSFIEDRYDPTKATVAACEHLNDLYDMFGDWFLVLAAYNAGAGNVRKAIRKAGGARDFWEIFPYLPQETRGYVPAFIAVNYVMNFYSDHNIKSAEPSYRYSETERVPVKTALTFEQLHETIGVPMEDLVFLNPQYTAGLLPSPGSVPNMIRLPRQYAQRFLDKERDIYAYRPEMVAEKERQYAIERSTERRKTVSRKSRNRKVHVVRHGGSLARIARRYGSSVSQLLDWNNLKTSRLRPGQKLVVSKGGSNGKG